MSEASNRFNSLTEQGLGLSDETLESPSDTLSDILKGTYKPPRRLRDEFNISELLTAQEELRKKSEPRFRDIISNEGWRCDYEFPHNGRVCNSFNGHSKGASPQARTVCWKCKRKRENPKTLNEEVQEKLNQQIEEELTKKRELRIQKFTESIPVEENDDY